MGSRSASIWYVGQLISYTPLQLIKIPQLGHKGIFEIKAVLEKYDLALAELALAEGENPLLLLNSDEGEGEEGLQKRLNAMTARLTNEINNICLHQNATFHIVNFGSLFKMKWDAEPAYCELIYVLLRDKGIHIYDGFPCFLTMAHTESDVDFIIEKYKDSILEMQVGGFFEKPTGNGKVVGVESNTSEPPVTGAKLGKDPQGNPGWFIPDPKRPGKYLQVK